MPRQEVPTRYEVEGEGSPVVFVNPGVLDCRIWDPQWPAFAARHRVLRYDPRGFRGSSKPEGAFSHVRDLRALLEVTGIFRAHVIRSSFGGSLALDFGAAHPHRVASLVLLGAARRLQRSRSLRDPKAQRARVIDSRPYRSSTVLSFASRVRAR